jgi:uncharacterized membrane protein
VFKVIVFVLCALIQEYVLLMLIRGLDESVLAAKYRASSHLCFACMGICIEITCGFEIDANTE